ncbi:MAG: ABC-2 transporter permease [Clostridium sp.]
MKNLISIGFKSNKFSIIILLIYVPFFAMLYHSSSDFNIDILLFPMAIFLSFTIAIVDLSHSKTLLSLPITRKTFIKSKYIFCLLFVLLVVLLGSIEAVIIKSLFNVKFNFHVLSSFGGIITGLSLTLTILAVTLPFNMLFNNIKKRSILNIIITIFLFGISGILLEMNNYLLSILPPYLTLIIPLIFLLVSVAAFIFSYFALYKIYAKKDF